MMIIILVTIKVIYSFNKSKEELSKFVYHNTLFFNLVTFASVLGLSVFAIFHLKADIENESVDLNKSYRVYHSFWVMFYGKQVT